MREKKGTSSKRELLDRRNSAGNAEAIVSEVESLCMSYPHDRSFHFLPIPIDVVSNRRPLSRTVSKCQCD